MSNYPLLPLPPPDFRPRDKVKGGFTPPPHCPSRQRQSQRIGPIFDRLKNLPNGDGLELVDDPAALAPERVIVFEVAKSIGDFAAACKKVAGLEFLAEQDFEIAPDQDFWDIDSNKKRRDDKLVMGRVYAAMPDVRALSDLVSLWRRFLDGVQPNHGFKPWFDLFKFLYGLRPWGPEDRISEGTLEDFRQELQNDPDGPITAEIELWHQDRPGQLEKMRLELERVVGQARGSVIHQSSIPEIAYEAALVKLPREAIVQLLNRDRVHVAVCDGIMFVRPQCSPHSHLVGERMMAGAAPTRTVPNRDLPPIAALLDGVPVQKHRLLDGRIDIDDPDELSEHSIVAKRAHGTAMASLILHGDLRQAKESLSRILHIHPVMFAPEGSRNEEFQPDRLLVDTIYQAILRMKKGTGDSDPTAPDVFLVNLSLGDLGRPYAGWISPWARLLDFLSYKYGILFIVSAGNIGDPLPVPQFHTLTEFEDADDSIKENAVIIGLGRQRSNRTLLSPSEAMNVVTVGAAHEDAAECKTGPYLRGALLDPYSYESLPNISSAMGLGHRKTIKPDILMPGGRELVRPTIGANECLVRSVPPGQSFGVRVAAPDAQGRLDQERNQSGTSIAAALATRAAHRLFDVMMDLESGAVLADADSSHYAVVIRALLVHGASWSEPTASKLEKLYGPHGQGKNVARLDNVARMIGFGVPKIANVVTCTPERATLVGFGEIENDQMAVCRLPLPESLSRFPVPRSITITLAWFSPVNARSRAYRMVRLEVSGDFEAGFGASRSNNQPSHYSIRRGTLFHQRYNGNKAVQSNDNEDFAFNITCKAAAGAIDEPVRYGLVVTIEAEEGIAVYQEISTRLRVRQRT